jgi:quinol-cytochrome oxidoreductase complex cytochrome b subunit
MGLASWLRERYPVDAQDLVNVTNEPVPNHLRHWWFCLGGTPAYLFLVQILTGILLAFYYVPDPVQAYDSVRYITEEVRFGWYLRGIHKWGATLMIAAVILHQIRVFFTGGYRKPRELSWVIGMFVLGCTLMLGFTGYSLVYEQLSYWGATVGANIMEQVPVVGSASAGLLRGGETVGRNTLTRLFILHEAVLPVVLMGLLVIHLALIRTQGVSELRFEADASRPRRTFPFVPDHLLTEMIIGLTLLLILSALACLVPVGMGPRANPLVTPEVIKPEWFFYFSFRWLKLFSGTFAVLSMGFLGMIMVLWPWFDASLRRRFRFQDLSVFVGAFVALAIIALTLWEALVTH